ncbi:MAG: lysine--tRNA ligase [Clostridia bacterium]|nr:lysine--tRNA ligase [Clostridia bacterium]
MENEEKVLLEEDYGEQVRIRREKLAGLVENGANPYAQTKFVVSDLSDAILSNPADYEGKTVTVAGRVLSRRMMGKASFAHILDSKGKIQIYVKRDNVGVEVYDAWKKADIGDIFGVEGAVFITHTGETSINATSITMLSKSLLPLPEKFHGLKDNDLRYRQRYVDLIANPEVKDNFVVRSKIIKAIRDLLDSKGFIEVETPVLNTIAGGASARPFVTHHNTLDLNMYMRIAPELYLKRLIVGGFDKVYEIGKMFRNEGMDIKHNPEFTMMELYQAYADYNDMMDITEEIYHAALNAVGKGDKITYEGVEIDLTSPWERLTMLDAIKKYVGIDYDKMSVEEALCAAKSAGVEIDDKKITWGDIVYETFDQKVEEKLIQPVFITDYPIEVSPLTKQKNDDPRLTYRFEFFIFAREMGNVYSELNDPIDQKERFLRQVALRDNGDDEAQMMDEDFVTALEYGMPPTDGLGIGIDRLIMLLTDSSSIRDVMLVPTMKPKK